jgi:uncharacterized protein
MDAASPVRQSIAGWIRRIGIGIAMAGLAAVGTAFAADQVPVPALKARVTDLTGTLSVREIRGIEATLQAFEQRKGSQIAVLMLPSTQPETIEQYSIRVAEAWKIGRAGVGDGAILVIAKDDHRLRIEVGRGLEGAIPDVIAKRVIREVIAPHLLNGDFRGGIGEGVATLMKLIEGEQLPPPRTQAAPSSSFEDYQSILILAFVLVVVAGGVLRAIFGRLIGSSLVGIVAGAAAWLIAGSVIAGTIAMIAAFLATLAFGASAGRFASGGGWGGWSGGGGGFGSGGFSGGGGDFGGGGASGSWGD